MNIETATYLQDNSRGFFKLSNEIINNRGLTNAAVGALSRIFNFLKQHPSEMMTKKKFMQVTKCSRTETDNIFRELEDNGYVYHIKILPHKRTDKDSPYVKNGWIQHSYDFYESPSLNINFQSKEGTEKKMISNTKQDVKVFKKEYETSTQINQIKETKVDNNINKEKAIYNHIIEKFKSSIFVDHLSNDFAKVELADCLKEFTSDKVDVNIVSDYCLESLADTCWNLIVRADSNNMDSYMSYRYSDMGIKTGRMMTNLIVNMFNKNAIYDKSRSILKGIRETTMVKGIQLNRLFLLRATEIIANYIELGFLLNDKNKKRIPDKQELILLYKTIEQHPELICLDYSMDSYLLFDKFYKNTLNNR